MTGATEPATQGASTAPAVEPVPTEVLLADRVGAVRASGWGTSVRLVQPRNLAFWVYAVLVGLGAVQLVRYLAGAAPVYGQVIVVAVVLFGLYAALFWWFTQRIDRYAHQPRKLIVLAFLWGGFGATIALASNANTPILSLWAKAFGTSWAGDWGAGLTAPFTEELAKGAGLLLLVALAPRAVATGFDAFVLGAFIGLGFQIVEDITYALDSAGSQFGADPVGNSLQTIALRIALGVASHVLYSAVFCTGLAHLLGRPALPRRVGVGLALMVTAMLFHGVWDDLGGIVGPYLPLLFAGWVVLIGLAILVVTRVFRFVIGPERDYMRAVLAPEVAAGTITAAELDTLAGDARARRAYRRGAADRPDRRHRALVLQAAHDLADELAAAGGAEGDRVAFARQEVHRLRAAPA